MINASVANTTVPAATAIVGTVLLSFAAAGYWLRNLNLFERAVIFAASLLLIQPGWITDVVGAGVGAAMYLLQKMTLKNKA